MSKATNRGQPAHSSDSKRSSRHAPAPAPPTGIRPPPSPRMPTLAEGGLQLLPSSAPSETKPENPPEDQPILYDSPKSLNELDTSSAPSETKPENPPEDQPILYDSPKSLNGDISLTPPPAGAPQGREEGMVSLPHIVRFDPPPLPSTSWPEEYNSGVPPVAGSSVGVGGESLSRPLRRRFPPSTSVTGPPLRPPPPGLPRLEEHTYSVPPSTSTTRPLRPRLLVPEGPTYGVPPSTTITIRVDQPFPSTPTRSTPRHDEPFQSIPPVFGSNVSESAHTPVHLEVERREESTYNVHPATTITIRVDQSVPPSLNGRSPRHEEPIVSVPAPVGSSVGETAPRPPRRRLTSREVPNPSIRPPTLPRTSRGMTLGQERRTPIAAPLTTSRDRSVSLPAFNHPPSPPLVRRPRVLDRPDPPVPASVYGKSVPLASSRSRVPEVQLDPPWVHRPSPLRRPSLPVPRAPISEVPPVAVTPFDRPVPLRRPNLPVPRESTSEVSPVAVATFDRSVPLRSPNLPVPRESTSEVPPVAATFDRPVPLRSPSPHFPVPRESVSEVPPVAATTFDRSVPPYSDPISPERIINRTAPPINDSLALVKEASALEERIPYILPVASLLERFTTQNASEVKQEWWGVVNDKVRKVARLVSDVVATCKDKNLEEDDLPRSLRTIFQSLESQLEPIVRARKQSENVGVIKKVLLDTYSQRQRKIEAYDVKLSNVLEEFQAALAFNHHFVEFAADIEVEVTNVNVRYDEDQTPLHVASQLGHVKVMRSLIDRGANPNAENEDGETPLFLVSRNGNEAATKLLLRRSARVNHQDQEKRTPLHGASENGHDSVTKLLLSSGADPNAKNVHDWTPLHLAARTGQSAVVKTLIMPQWHAEINAQNNSRSTPLLIAAQKGHREVVELLLKNDAVVDISDAHGDTALHLAAYYGHSEIVELLIKHKAKVRTQNKERKSSLDVAKRGGHEKVVQLLKPLAEVREG